MKTFTVFGYYDDTGEAYGMPFKGHDQYEAMTAAADATDSPETLCIIGAVQGKHKLLTPGCDNIQSAFATDLRSE